MPRVRSFPPVEDQRARILILGSMPGVASLRAGQYYAHPRNLFWRLLCDVFEADPAMPYAKRIALLKVNRIALWDVLASCDREGSLDSAIDDRSAVANDFAAFYRGHRRIRHLFFNGAKAEAGYRRHVLPELGEAVQRPHACLRLPSTSPAHAALTYAQKLLAWRTALGRARGDRA